MNHYVLTLLQCPVLVSPVQWCELHIYVVPFHIIFILYNHNEKLYETQLVLTPNANHSVIQKNHCAKYTCTAHTLLCLEAFTTIKFNKIFLGRLIRQLKHNDSKKTLSPSLNTQSALPIYLHYLHTATLKDYKPMGLVDRARRLLCLTLILTKWISHLFESTAKQLSMKPPPP